MKKLLFALLLSISALASAIEPGWYAPLDGSGQGVIVRCNSDNECVFSWLAHADGQAWLISQDNCPRADAVCNLEFLRPSGIWMRSDSLELGEVLVSAEIEATADSIIVDYNAMRLFPETCFGITPGGLIFRNCIGVEEFFLLAK